MPSALVSLASAAAPSPVAAIAVGLDPVLAGRRVRGLPEAVGRSLLATLRRTGTLDAPKIAGIVGDEDDIGAMLLLPGRAPGWTAVEVVELAAALHEAIPVVIVAGQPSSLARTPAHLAGLLREHGVAPTFAGSLPAEDSLTPGCAVAILERRADGVEAPTVAALVDVDRPSDLLPHTVHALAAEGIEVILIDRTGDTAETLPGGAVEVARPREDRNAALTRAAERTRADWVLHFSADERPVGPWLGVGLRETVARIAKEGADTASATVVLHPPTVATPERDPVAMPILWRFSTAPADTGRVVLWRRGFGPGSPQAGSAQPARWNLLLRRFTPPVAPVLPPPSPFAVDDGWLADAEGPASDPAPWLPWDEAEFAERYLAERLTGKGAFRRTYPVPPRCTWVAEERMLDWHGNVFKTAVGRLPSPDPANPQPGSCLIRWDTLDGSVASLFVARPGQPERFAARSAQGTVSIDLIQPNGAHYARLYDGDDRQRLLGELRFGFTMDVGA